jgi:hypothetical protein
VLSCSFNGLEELPPVPLPHQTNGYYCITATLGLNNNQYQKMIYLNDVYSLTFSGNNFNGDYTPGFYKNIMEVYGSGANTSNQISVLQSAVHGNFDNGFLFNSTNDITFDHNDFQSAMHYGFSANTGSGGCYVSNNTFTSPYLATHNPFYFKNIQAMDMFSNTINGADNAIQYYADNTYNNVVAIRSNTMQNCRMGIVIASDQHPESTIPTANNTTHTITMDIYCNEFDGNNAAIFGSGNMMAQGTPADGNNNVFNSSLDWDILWNDGSLNYYHYTYTPNSAPSLSFNNYYVNGLLRSTSNVSLPAASAESCTRTNIPNKPSGIKQFTNSEVTVYPNPFTDRLIVNLPENLRSQNTIIEIRDIVGRIVYTTNSKNQGSIEIATNNIAAGTYFINMVSENDTVTIKKLVKLKNV